MEGGPSQIVLVRHGETEWSRSGQHTGTTDLPLTARGREQAAAIGERLAGRDFARVITSPLSRAMETCRLAGLGALAEVAPGLTEWRYGSYEGRTTPDIRTEVEGWTVWHDGAPAARARPTWASAWTACSRSWATWRGRWRSSPTATCCAFSRTLARARARGWPAAHTGHGHPVRARVGARDARDSRLERALGWTSSYSGRRCRLAL